MSNSKTSRVESYILALSVGIHIFALSTIIWKAHPWLTGDSGRYLNLSAELLSSGCFGLPSSEGCVPEAMRSPGYPLLIAASTAIFGKSNFGIVLMHSFMYLVSIGLVWRIATETFSKTTGVIFLLLSSLYPFVMYSVGQISPEIPAMFLLCLAAFLMLKPSSTRIVAAAVLIALSAYLRPNLILLNGLFAIGLIFLNYRNWRQPVLVGVTAILIAAPFAVRNYLVFEKLTPLPIASGGGNSLMLASWMGKVSLPSLIEYGMKGQATEELKASGMLEQVAEINRQIGVPEDTIFVTVESYPTNETRIRANELMTKAAIRNITEDPMSYASVVLSNGVRMWFTSQIPDSFPAWMRFALLFNGISVALLALLGLGIALTRKEYRSNVVVISHLGSFIYCIVTLSWLHTEARYTIPVRLFLLMFSSYALCFLLQKVGSGRYLETHFSAN